MASKSWSTSYCSSWQAYPWVCSCLFSSSSSGRILNSSWLLIVFADLLLRQCFVVEIIMILLINLDYQFRDGLDWVILFGLAIQSHVFLKSFVVAAFHEFLELETCARSCGKLFLDFCIKSEIQYTGWIKNPTLRENEERGFKTFWNRCFWGWF